MKIELWSAGEHGYRAKEVIIACVYLVICQLSLTICIMSLSYKVIPADNTYLYITIFKILSVLITFMALILLFMSIMALLKNTKFEIEVLSYAELKQSNYTINDIVFYDADGVVVTYNKEAYYDWEMFNRRESFREFKLLH